MKKMPKCKGPFNPGGRHRWSDRLRPWYAMPEPWCTRCGEWKKDLLSGKPVVGEGEEIVGVIDL